MSSVSTSGSVGGGVGSWVFLLVGRVGPDARGGRGRASYRLGSRGRQPRHPSTCSAARRPIEAHPPSCRDDRGRRCAPRRTPPGRRSAGTGPSGPTSGCPTPTYAPIVKGRAAHDFITGVPPDVRSGFSAASALEPRADAIAGPSRAPPAPARSPANAVEAAARATVGPVRDPAPERQFARLWTARAAPSLRRHRQLRRHAHRQLGSATARSSGRPDRTAPWPRSRARQRHDRGVGAHARCRPRRGSVTPSLGASDRSHRDGRGARREATRRSRREASGCPVPSAEYVAAGAAKPWAIAERAAHTSPGPPRWSPAAASARRRASVRRVAPRRGTSRGSWPAISSAGPPGQRGIGRLEERVLILQARRRRDRALAPAGSRPGVDQRDAEPLGPALDLGVAGMIHSAPSSAISPLSSAHGPDPAPHPLAAPPRRSRRSPDRSAPSGGRDPASPAPTTTTLPTVSMRREDAPE